MDHNGYGRKRLEARIENFQPHGAESCTKRCARRREAGYNGIFAEILHVPTPCGKIPVPCER